MRTFSNILFFLIIFLSFATPVAITSATVDTLYARLNMTSETTEPTLYAGSMHLKYVNELSYFYDRVSYEPTWSTVKGVRPVFWKCIVILETLRDDSHSALTPHLNALNKLANEVNEIPTNISLRIQLDLLFTDVLLSVCHNQTEDEFDLRSLGIGRSYREPVLQFAEKIYQNRNATNLVSYLTNLRYINDDTKRLRSARSHYETIVKQGGWFIIPSGAVLRSGMRSPRIPLVRKRLLAEGYSVVSKRSRRYDRALATVVKEYQHRNGLKPDGVIGKNTLAQLNVSAEKRLAQIDLNLRRWKWLPNELGHEHIRVNIPEGRLRLFRENDEILAMDVITGKKETPTPCFSDTISYLVLNPSWEIPRTIVNEIVLPGAASDSAYFADRDIAVYRGWGRSSRRINPARIHWSTFAERGHAPYRFVRSAGRLNPMGRIKFMFPNPFNVYLHDTPSRYLFRRHRHTYSHGCVRVREPIRLAVELLRSKHGWDAKRLSKVFQSSESNVLLYLKNPVPVHLTYFTSWADRKGLVHFRPDIYGWDSLTAEALQLVDEKGL